MHRGHVVLLCGRSLAHRNAGDTSNAPIARNATVAATAPPAPVCAGVNAAGAAYVWQGELEMGKLNAWLGKLLKEKGTDIYRMKGVLAIAGMAQKFVFQGVHMLFDGQPLEGETWGADEKKVRPPRPPHTPHDAPRQPSTVVLGL